jgi:hypothetical protein
MVNIYLPAVIDIFGLIVIAVVIWAGQPNSVLPQVHKKSSARPSDFGLDGLFKFFDRFHLRSGQATVNDLAKGIAITLLLGFVPWALLQPLPIALWSGALVELMVAGVLFMHPALSGAQSFKNNLAGQSPFKKK